MALWAGAFLAQMADATTTWALLRENPDGVREGNPVMRWVLGVAGVPGMFAVKAAAWAWAFKGRPMDPVESEEQAFAFMLLGAAPALNNLGLGIEVWA
jgi:hypothetical protein